MVDFIEIDCSFPFDQVLKILDYETFQLQSNLNIPCFMFFKTTRIKRIITKNRY